MRVSDRADPVDLAALIGSRICHDLISPVGAIGNGLELLNMSGAAGPELALIGESVDNANARIRFFRIAFGLASPDQLVGHPEITSILDDVYRAGRLKVRWDIAEDCARPDVRLAFLAIQCLETAMPYGGEIVVARRDDGWHATGVAAKMKLDEALWSGLESGAVPKVAANCVHFPLLSDGLKRIGRALSVTRADGEIDIAF